MTARGGDYLDLLIARSRALGTDVRPRPASRFEHAGLGAGVLGGAALPLPDGPAAPAPAPAPAPAGRGRLSRPPSRTPAGPDTPSRPRSEPAAGSEAHAGPPAQTPAEPLGAGVDDRAGDPPPRRAARIRPVPADGATTGALPAGAARSRTARRDDGETAEPAARRRGTEPTGGALEVTGPPVAPIPRVALDRPGSTHGGEASTTTPERGPRNSGAELLVPRTSAGAARPARGHRPAGNPVTDRVTGPAPEPHGEPAAHTGMVPRPAPGRPPGLPHDDGRAGTRDLATAEPLPGRPLETRRSVAERPADTRSAPDRPAPARGGTSSSRPADVVERTSGSRLGPHLEVGTTPGGRPPAATGTGRRGQAQTGGQSRRPTAAEPDEVVVSVVIGRVEIRAVTPHTPPARPRRERPATMDLDAHLRERRR